MSNLVKNKPTGPLRWLLRMPRWLYHAGLGWILGQRFLLLRYVGRKSGLLRETVIEVVGHDKENDTYYVASGWGDRSDWFQSIRTNPDVQIQVGRRKLSARAQVVDAEEGARQLFVYARNHPSAFRELSRLITGKAFEGTDKECHEFARMVPVIAFHPKAG
jgi:deazaflavin-dependent oxidoreductase (nitroreductase family)